MRVSEPAGSSRTGSLSSRALRDHLRGDLVDEVPQRDHEGRGVDAGEAVELVEADAHVLVPGAAAWR